MHTHVHDHPEVDRGHTPLSRSNFLWCGHWNALGPLIWLYSRLLLPMSSELSYTSWVHSLMVPRVLTLYCPVTPYGIVVFHTPIRIYMEDLILGSNTLYILLCFTKPFSMGCKELSQWPILFHVPSATPNVLSQTYPWRQLPQQQYTKGFHSGGVCIIWTSIVHKHSNNCWLGRASGTRNTNYSSRVISTFVVHTTHCYVYSYT